jgi:DMSO/TMAO reductase YedYZ molybdopterin-dependent catalytic subunit
VTDRERGFRVFGQVEQPTGWSSRELEQLPQVDLVLDDGRAGRGIAARELLSRVRLGRDARFVLVHATEGPVTMLPLAVFAGPRVVLALGGAGLRLLVPGREPLGGVCGVELLAKAWALQ